MSLVLRERMRKSEASMTSGGIQVPVMRPRLPLQSALAPYLRRIDESRTYTNFGPLHLELESRLAEYFGVHETEILLVANGTLALQGAIETASVRDTRWVIPSWTFVASAEAVSSAKREIFFGDVNSTDWRLQLSLATAQEPHIVVAPFGDSPRLREIRQIVAESPVIVDAASCFDACGSMGSDIMTNALVMVSLHATKLVTTGEGGVLIGDPQWISDVKRWSNFGFRGRRIADVRGTNAKLSEYSAAVGLASLDAWSRTKEELAVVATHYRQTLEEIGLSLQPALDSGHVTSTAVVRFADGAVRNHVRDALYQSGIETRAWWSEGVHRMETFADCPRREELLVTDNLASTTLGLPFFIDMTDTQIDAVVRTIGALIGR